MSEILTEPTDEILEAVTEAFCQYFQGRKVEGINITDVYQHNACNHTFTGVINHEGVEYGFVMSSGDMAAGVEQWGLADDVGGYEPPVEIARMFVPQEISPLPCRIYLHWRERGWLIDKKSLIQMEREMNYDMHFAPGGKTNKYYSDWATKKGMKIGYETDLPRIREMAKEDHEQWDKDVQAFVSVMEATQ